MAWSKPLEGCEEGVLVTRAPERPVLIVEDHPLVAETTADLVTRFEPAAAPAISPNATHALERLECAADYWFRIFLDLGVPGAYGLSLANEIRLRGLAARCCVITGNESREYVAALREAGFLGYIFKGAPVAEFTTALRAIFEGSSWFPAAAALDVPPVRLTRRQIQLLHALRLGLSSRQIAARLHLTEGTVNNYVAAMLHLFNANSRAHAVAKAIELGVLES
jgi:two-component system response regulator DesR